MAVGKALPLAVVITAIDRFTAPFNRITTRLNRATAPLRAVSHSFSELNKAAGFPRLAESARGVVSAVGDIGAAAQRSAMRIAGIGAAGAGLAFVFKRQFIDSADLFERLGLGLTAIEGNADKARKSMAFIKDLAIRTPFEMTEVVKAFALMRGADMNPMEGSLQAIIDQVSKFSGGTADALQGVTLAFTQMFSSGRINAQDMLQLTSRNIPAWAILGRAMGKTVAQVRKMGEGGVLGLKEINLLWRQFAKESGGAAESFMGTWSGMVSNLADQWFFFKARVLKLDDLGQAIPGGPMDRIKKKLQSLLDLLAKWESDGTLQRWADTFQAKFEQLFAWFDEHWPTIKEGVLSTLKQIGAVLRWLAKNPGIAKLGLLLYVLAPLIGAVFGLVTAFGVLAGVIGLTPVGWILLGIAAIGTALAILAKDWPNRLKAWNDFWEGMKDVGRGFVKFLNGEFSDGVVQAVLGIVKTVSTLPGMKFPVIAAMYLRSIAGGPRDETVAPDGGVTVAPQIADRLDRLAKLRESARRLRDQVAPTPAVPPRVAERLESLEQLRASVRRLREQSAPHARQPTEGIGHWRRFLELLGLGLGPIVGKVPKVGTEPSQGPTIGPRPIFSPSVPSFSGRRTPAAAVVPVKSEASVTVTFEGTPPGTRVTRDRRSNLDLTLDVGYNLRTA